MKSFNSEAIKTYLSLIKKDKFPRYKSWDNCYNAFSENLSPEIYALHLGFYLASWGMYRGSTGLLQTNHQIHAGAVKILFSDDFKTLKLDSSKKMSKDLIPLLRGSIPLIIMLKTELSKYYNGISYTKEKRKNISSTDTLLSKILLGTIACVPAYDGYYVNGLKVMEIKESKFDGISLNKLFDFIEINFEEIEHVQKLIMQEMGFHYPLMKIMDMHFWQIGFNNKAKSG